jgi:hypothetical protein
VPNLIANCGFWVAGCSDGLNVRRLMYQTLIWAAVSRDQARCLRPPGNAKDCNRLADPLIDRVRGDIELGGDFLGRQELVDQPKAIELALA